MNGTITSRLDWQWLGRSSMSSRDSLSLKAPNGHATGTDWLVYTDHLWVVEGPFFGISMGIHQNWLVVWNHGIFWLSIQLGISSSQLTFIFFRGVETTNQTNYGQEYSLAPFWGPEIPSGNPRPPDGVACRGPADLWDWKKTKAQRSADTFPVRVRD